MVGGRTRIAILIKHAAQLRHSGIVLVLQFSFHLLSVLTRPLLRLRLFRQIQDAIRIVRQVIPFFGLASAKTQGPVRSGIHNQPIPPIGLVSP